MTMAVDTEEQKQAKITAVKTVYDMLGIGDEARDEIIRLHGQAMGYIEELGLAPEAAAALENYAKNLIGRAK